jgi:hypothetical protein
VRRRYAYALSKSLHLTFSFALYVEGSHNLHTQIGVRSRLLRGDCLAKSLLLGTVLRVFQIVLQQEQHVQGCHPPSLHRVSLTHPGELHRQDRVAQPE